MGLNEEWRVIQDFPNYAVSNMGRVKRIADHPARFNERILKQRLNQCGYPTVRFKIDGKEQIRTIHQLVLESFVCPRPFGDITANHKDGKKINNNLWNLEWCTRKDNLRHAYSVGLMHIGVGSAAHSSKLKPGEAWLVWKLLDAGINRIMISKMFKLHFSTIYLILKKKRYVNER